MATALPATTDFTGGSQTEGDVKSAFAALIGYLTDLFGTDGELATALATLGAIGSGYAAKTTTYSVVADDKGKLIDATSGTWTLGLLAAATAGDGFAVAARNSGTGVITVDANLSETIDGATTLALNAGESVILYCDGSNWHTLSRHASKLVATTEGTPYTTYTTVTTAVPVDDSIPQNTEGDQIATVSHTPKSATNRLRIEVDVDMVTGSAAIDAAAALFQDSTADALAWNVEQFNGAAVYRGMRLVHEMAAGTTSAITFKLRMGPGSGTLYINGNSAGRRGGGISAVRMRVIEMTP